MATGKAPVKLTGGGGFTFADRVGAYYLGHMLSGGLPLGPAFGMIDEIKFEVRDAGWLLDDLLLISKPAGPNKHHCAVSVKSNSQVTQGGFPKDFTTSVWEQVKGKSAPFNSDTDLLALGTARVVPTVKTAWDQLIVQTDSDAKRLLSRLKPEGQSSEIQRSLFTSLHCPPEVCSSGPDELATTRLLRNIRLLDWDFGSEPSLDESNAVSLCRAVLLDGDTDTATSLWSRLQHVASEARSTGATHNLISLLAALRPEFELRDHPDFQPDWDKLKAQSEEMKDGVRTVVGDSLRISRTETDAKIKKALSETQTLALLGESGSGKSALLVTLLAGVSSGTPVLWLDHTQFAHPNHSAVAHELSLRYTCPELVKASSAKSGFIILDSIERFSPQALHRAGELMRAVGESSEWKILITCQPQSWETVVRELFLAGIRPNAIKTTNIGLPATATLIAATRDTAPGVASLLYRKELRSILCNLKVLDWVLTEQVLRSEAEHQTLVGETDVIEWIWNRWLGSSENKFARASLLMRIAEHEAGSFGASVKFSDLRLDEQLVLGSLEKDQLIRVRHGNIGFTHDLLGDWARLQSLMVKDFKAVETIRQVVRLPRWQSAVRLFGQQILEHKDGAVRWADALTLLEGNEPEDLLALDCFLDALLFAGNAESLLEQVWPQLTGDKGKYLRRFLKRFLQVATLPDPRFADLAAAEDLDWLATAFRIPHILYWYAPLRVFDRHVADLCKLALIVSAEMCELWLRNIPPELGGRPEAAHIAIELARESQGLRAEDGWFEDHADRKVYEALCHATPDFPDDVSVILLELCHRRDQDASISARVAVFRKKRRAEERERLKNIPPEEIKRRRSLPPPIGFSDRGPLREQAADGPKARVLESFQQAILNSTALLSVVNVRPAIAREVLLAVCIDEPKRDSYHDLHSGDDFGTAHWQGGHPAMYFRGPFLRFLELQTEEGIEAIARLVNYATGRWAERFLVNAPDDLDPDIYSVELDLPNGPIRWTGNFNVFGWYRDIMIGSNAVASALMALEKWLYDNMEQGKDTAPWLDRIFSASSSIAFAGILVAVGIKYPKLLAGPLRPILGSWRLMDWQQHLAPQDDVWRIGMVGWAGSGERVYEQVVQWHTMPHRRVLLRDVAVRLLLFDQNTRGFLGQKRRAWLQELEHKLNEPLQLLAARLDIANYSQTDLGDGQIQVEFEWTEDIREDATRRADEAQKGVRALAFPHRCRAILSGELEPPEGDSFWDEFHSVVDWKNRGEPEKYAVTPDTIAAAGIAVLLTYHSSWLAQQPERYTWCLERLKQIEIGPRDAMDTPHSVSDTYTEAFVGEAALTLIPQAEAVWVRDLVARGIMSFHYTSTRAVMMQAFKQRDRLGEDFGRIVNLLKCWAGLRGVTNHTEQLNQSGISAVDRMGKRIASAFIDKRLPSSDIPLKRIRSATRRFTERITSRNPSPWARRFDSRREEIEEQRQIDRPYFWLDTEVLSRGFGFLGTIPSDHTRGSIIGYHKEIVALFLETMPLAKKAYQEVEGTPYEFDRWVLRLATATVAQLPESEARPFWKRCVDLGPGAHYWVRDYFYDWFMTGRNFVSSLDVFAARWREMISYCLEAPGWSRETARSHWLEECWTDLMGLGLTLDIVGAKEFLSVVTASVLLFEKWASEWLSSARSAIHFANFLTMPAGRALLPKGIVWLSSGVNSFSEYDWKERNVGDALAGALRACWRNYRDSVAADAVVREHFLKLLNALCNRLNADAINLRSEVSQHI